MPLISLLGSIFLFFIFFIMVGCEEETPWELEIQEKTNLVVQAIITDEYKKQKIILSQVFADRNGAIPPIRDAQVRVTNDEEEYLFDSDSTDEGSYYSRSAFAARMGQTYRLSVIWREQLYTAESAMVQVIPIIDIQLGQNAEGLYYISEGPPIYSPQEQALYQVDIEWTDPSDTSDASARLYYYTLSTIDVSELLRPKREDVFFPSGSKIVITKYSLQDDFAEYYRSILMESSWQAGVFDDASYTPRGNISDDAFGFFGVSAVFVDSIIVQ